MSLKISRMIEIPSLRELLKGSIKKCTWYFYPLKPCQLLELLQPISVPSFLFDQLSFFLSRDCWWTPKVFPDLFLHENCTQRTWLILLQNPSHMVNSLQTFDFQSCWPIYFLQFKLHVLGVVLRRCPFPVWFFTYPFSS